MVSPFDKIPQEVLDRIIQYAAADNKVRHQLQLVNKLWYSAAEKYVYEELDLKRLSRFKIFKLLHRGFEELLGPRRSKFVKTVRISFEDMPGGSNGMALPLGDNFFKVFPNINKVYRCDEYDHHGFWSYLQDNFTSKTCKLKELVQDADHAFIPYSGYVAMVLDHAYTLEKLSLPDLDSLHINVAAVFFPNVKELTIHKYQRNLQDLDDVISKCPKLEFLSVSIGKKGAPNIYMDDDIYEDEDQSLWIEKLFPKQQHQQNMRNIRVEYLYSRDLPSICSYLTAKFSDVQQWILNRPDFRDNAYDDFRAVVNPSNAFFDEFGDYLRHMAKSKEIAVKFRAYCTYNTEAFDFLFSLCQPHLWKFRVAFGRDILSKEDLNNLSDRSKDADIAVVDVEYCNISGEERPNQVSITKRTSERSQLLDDLEKIGQHMKPENIWGVVSFRKKEKARKVT